MTRWYQEEIMERWKKDGDNENFYIFLPYWIFQHLFLLFVCFRPRLSCSGKESFRTGTIHWAEKLHGRKKSLDGKDAERRKREEEGKEMQSESSRSVVTTAQRCKEESWLARSFTIYPKRNGGKSCSFINKNHSCL